MINQYMQKLTQEHVECLSLADRLDRIVRRGDSTALAAAVQWVREYNARELEPHLQHEEQTIFGPLIREHHEQAPLCIRLGKEHGFLRTLAENISEANARQDLAEFARVLRSHTLAEEQQLFPLLDALFTPAQWEAVRHFIPLGRQPVMEPDEGASLTRQQADPDAWLAQVDAHFRSAKQGNAHIALLPRYQPELLQRLAEHLGIAFFDYRQEVMSGLRERADTLTLKQMEQTLREQSRQQGLICHNAEALLCVKPEEERRAWLKQFTATDWPHLVIVPLTVFQADAPDDPAHICDLELVRLPRHKEGRIGLGEPLRYAV